MPCPPRRPIRPALAALTLALAACGGTATQPAKQVAVPAGTAVSHGTVIALRPVAFEGSSVRSRILAAIGTADAAGQAGSVEFIIRQDDGQALSIVQRNDLGLRPGDQITLMHGTHTRIAGPSS